MSNPIPAIVVVAYNRPDSLARLLHSISQARYPARQSIPLVISIDGGGSQSAAVRGVAAAFDWPYGDKEIIDHQENLGLVAHVFCCGDLSERFGRIILLEDDLFVGKGYFEYAQQALAFYADDPQIGAVSLSALWFHGFTQLPFTPYPDVGDSFFMQLAWYQGQAYTADQWRRFREWLAENGPDGWPVATDNMHPMFSRFPKTDWFPLKTRYLVKTGRFYAFPRESLAVNFGETGTHFAKQTPFFQVPLQESPRRWHFEPLATAVAVYDSWQEMLPDRLKRLAPELQRYDFETDFYGERDASRSTADFLLTTQPSAGYERRWALAMRPPEANLVHGVAGDGIRLVRPDSVTAGWRGRLTADWRKYAYFSRHRPRGRRALWRLWLGHLLNRF